jgi:hypothetical protein
MAGNSFGKANQVFDVSFGKGDGLRRIRANPLNFFEPDHRSGLPNEKANHFV